MTGTVTVPRVPTPAMLKAACTVMAIRQQDMGADWVRVSNAAKARIRWEAMLAAWEAETAPPLRWEIAARAVARNAAPSYPTTEKGQARVQAYVDYNWRRVWDGWQVGAMA